VGRVLDAAQAQATEQLVIRKRRTNVTPNMDSKWRLELRRRNFTH
jgi:hypothetical protein